MVVFELTMFLSGDSASCTRFILAVVPCYMVIPEKTLRDVHAAIRWGWEWALQGQYATVDHLGQTISSSHGNMRFANRGLPLCPAEPRYRMAIVAFKADAQYDKATFKFHSYDSNYMCPYCFGHKRLPDLLYSQVGPLASWRGHLRTTESYLAERDGDVQALALIPGWHLSLHRGDPMHIIFLGVGLHFLGSCLWEIARSGFFGYGTIKKQLASAWLHMKRWVSAHGLQCSQSRFTKLSLQIKHGYNYPEIKAKAHNCRVMLAWMADLTSECSNDGSTHPQLRATAAWALADFCAQCDAHRHWKLSVDLADLLHSQIMSFLYCYKRLATLALANRMPLWAWKPKHHYMEHFADTLKVERLHPRLLWNFAEEDVIGLAIGVASGTHRSTIVERTMDRLYIRMALALSGRGRPLTGPPPGMDSL